MSDMSSLPLMSEQGRVMQCNAMRVMLGEMNMFFVHSHQYLWLLQQETGFHGLTYECLNSMNIFL